jgi:hypothetical protein
MSNKMVRGLLAIVLAGIFPLAPRVAAQTSPQKQSDDITITGTVTCSKYIYSKPDRKGFTPAEAIRMCVSQGYSYVLVSGRNVYPLEGDRNKLAKLAGEKVTVTGHVDTDVETNTSYTYHQTVSATTISSPTK